MSVFTFPIRQGDNRIGALDLYRTSRTSVGPLDASAMETAQTFANLAAAYLLQGFYFARPPLLAELADA